MLLASDIRPVIKRAAYLYESERRKAIRVLVLHEPLVWMQLDVSRSNSGDAANASMGCCFRSLPKGMHLEVYKSLSSLNIHQVPVPVVDTYEAGFSINITGK